MSEQHSELKNIVEAALLAAEEPLSVSALAALFPEDAQPTADQLKEVFEQLDRDYEGRGVELRRVGKGYRFQSREKYSPWLRKLSEGRPPRYSRAFLETLAIIAYRQPVTRGDIEEIRGVTVSSDIMRQLLDRDWVKEVGHRDVPGRPALLGTTRQFLEYFNLEALSDLPPLLERREATEIAKELNFRLPLESEQGGDGQEATPVDEQGAGRNGEQSEDEGDRQGDDPGMEHAVDQEAPRAENPVDQAGNPEATPDTAAEHASEDHHARDDDGDAGVPVDDTAPEAAVLERADNEVATQVDGEQENARQEDHRQRDDSVAGEDRDEGRNESQDKSRDENRETHGSAPGSGTEDDETATDPRPSAQVISFDEALNSREGDGEAS